MPLCKPSPWKYIGGDAGGSRKKESFCIAPHGLYAEITLRVTVEQSLAEHVGARFSGFSVMNATYILTPKAIFGRSRKRVSPKPRRILSRYIASRARKECSGSG